MIQSNDKAIRAYQSVGFEIAREFHSFKGRVQPPEKHVQKGLIAYASPEEFSQLDHPSFWSFQPSWENSIESIHRNIQAYTIYFIQDNDKTCGYAVVHSATGLIKQFGVLHEKRRQGYGTTLFKAISKQHSEIKIINIDKIDTVTLEFLNKIGLVDYIQQFEMHAANV
ncbi:GNAT family N-acetyltransferase [Alkalicoccobacillus plakortidis]|uniref:GNAT family N-acetyltransferase n=1 Tax=Alkalicoccobacillus plakortidis TaxID=444060 RepID=A0ABT0XMW9_9BACI|nr:GNAT family N-acetyltransferase [Alkalicoccobacillus plakortidis]MCM2677080.1 GNAT family N-acetyltransferase [Alkalicoccobacillus plakortidis]